MCTIYNYNIIHVYVCARLLFLVEQSATSVSVWRRPKHMYAMNTNCRRLNSPCKAERYRHRQYIAEECAVVGL